MGSAERAAAFVLSLAGLGFLVDTGHHGGKMVFEHAAGVPDSMLRAELKDRSEGHVHGAGEPADHHGDADHHDHADDHDHGAAAPDSSPHKD
jgi:hypothetical protein